MPYTKQELTKIGFYNEFIDKLRGKYISQLVSRALNFFRDSKNIKKNVYHHLGIYSYQLETLKKFVSLSQSQNEIKNKLEQLRALDNNIKINVSLAKEGPIGIDTEKDFIAIKKIMEYKSK